MNTKCRLLHLGSARRSNYPASQAIIHDACDLVGVRPFVSLLEKTIVSLFPLYFEQTTFISKKHHGKPKSSRYSDRSHWYI